MCRACILEGMGLTSQKTANKPPFKSQVKQLYFNPKLEVGLSSSLKVDDNLKQTHSNYSGDMGHHNTIDENEQKVIIPFQGKFSLD